MQNLGFLGSGTAFGVSVHKKDGLHLSQAWLVIVIQAALYIAKVSMLSPSPPKLEKQLCMEEAHIWVPYHKQMK